MLYPLSYEGGSGRGYRAVDRATLGETEADATHRRARDVHAQPSRRRRRCAHDDRRADAACPRWSRSSTRARHGATARGRARRTAPRGRRRGRRCYVPSEPSLTHQRRVGHRVHCVRRRAVRRRRRAARARLRRRRDARVRGRRASDAIGGVGGFMVNGAPQRVRALDRCVRPRLGRARARCCRRAATSPWSTEPDGLLDVEWLSGAAMSYRRALLEQRAARRGAASRSRARTSTCRSASAGMRGLVVTPDARVHAPRIGGEPCGGRGAGRGRARGAAAACRGRARPPVDRARRASPRSTSS